MRERDATRRDGIGVSERPSPSRSRRRCERQIEREGRERDCHMDVGEQIKVYAGYKRFIMPAICPTLDLRIF